MLGDAIFWIAAVCCLVAQTAIIRSTLRSHTPAPAGQQMPRPRTAVELAWVLLPALALAGVFALTWRAMHETQITPSSQVSAAGVEHLVR
jgi:heme/copper-type cytochrome/quinol oxidase subunit 2